MKRMAVVMIALVVGMSLTACGGNKGGNRTGQGGQGQSQMQQQGGQGQGQGAQPQSTPGNGDGGGGVGGSRESGSHAPSSSGGA
ncbi:hypothetical protein [Paenibacillus silviterrae]|uniref:hypothetical protein n=1 Tax=Paenibacillus silviterrae TaxID=3242194 RepID=UPI002542E277|nr:hypothetical protein [Paenibacillus chinjuensis]